MNDDLDIRDKARALSDKKAWDEALPLYEQLYAPKCDKWLAWEYSRCLKSLGKIEEALVVSKELYSRDANFNYNNSILTWLLYEKCFKNPKDSYNYTELNKLYDTAIFITKTVEQNDKSAYQKTIVRMLKLLYQHSNNPHEKGLALLDKLDVSMLAEKAGTYKQGEREKEFRSDKEMYYSYKTKALISCKKYDECILCCDEAFSAISDFHNDIDVWVLSRKAMSLAKLNKFDEAIILLKETITKKDHYSLLESLGDIYLINNEIDNALLFYCRAALTKDTPEMKVKLYPKIAKLLCDVKNTESALKHVLFTIQVRKQNEWQIPNDLQALYDKLSPDNAVQEIKLPILKDFWLSIIYEKMTVHIGNVLRLNAGGKTGFIKSNTGSYFFKISSFYDRLPVKENDKVKFVLIDSFNAHKQEATKECAYIKFDKNKKIL